MAEEKPWDDTRQQRFWKRCGLTFKDEIGYYGYYKPVGQQGLEWVAATLDITDLNALFKWAVPILQDKEHQIELLGHECNGFMVTIYESCFSARGSDGFDPWLNPRWQSENENPALALAEAIEKALEAQDG